jgi:hypothetical protein
MIGNWWLSNSPGDSTWNLSYSSNGTFTESLTSTTYPEDDPMTLSGSWTNVGNDFNALSQTYNLRPNHLDPPYGTGEEGDYDAGNTTRIFSEDFNEFRYSVARRYDGSVVGSDVYIRQ